MEVGTALAMTHMLAAQPRQFSAGQVLVHTAVPIVTSIGATVAAIKLDAGPRLGNATHGAIWGALGGAALGLVIDGRDEHDGAKAGLATKILAGLGGATFGTLGALLPDDRVQPIFLGGPIVAGAGTLVIGTVAIFAATPDRPGRILGIAGAATILGALTVGTIAAFAADPVTIEPAREGRADRTRARRRAPVMLSRGGSY